MIHRLIPIIAFAFTLSLSAAAERPNIVFILADDMGSGDIQALNAKSTIPTPHLNRLAAEGMTFTDAHSPSAVCTPTRYTTLTGRYCWRSEMKQGVLNGYGAPIIETDRPTVASHLQKAGYQTAVIGKWHLGLGFQKNAEGDWAWDQPLDYSPIDVGFDRSLIIPASLDFPPYIYIEGHDITGQPDRTQPAIKFPDFLREGELGSDFSIVDCLDKLTEETVKYLRAPERKEAPFFLYFPLTAPHKPVSPHPRFQGKSELGPYGDFIMQVDWTVGQVLDALDEAALAENTLIMYTSDNGSFMYRLTDEGEPHHVADQTVQAYYEGHHTANGIYRGTKADIYEGGHRVPFLARWPQVVEAGSECAQPICHADLFATAMELAGGQLPDPRFGAQDSYSLVPLLQGRSSIPRAPVVHHSGGAMFAIRDGDWKLILGSGSGGRQQPRGKKWELPYQLYNLADDPGETNNLFASHREKADELSAKMQQLFADDRSRPIPRGSKSKKK